MRGRYRSLLALGLMAISTCFWGQSQSAFAADHRDGPLLANSTFVGHLDLNDLYLFRGANRNNTVLVLTCSPAAGVVSPPVFFPGAFYEYRIDNTGDFNDNLLIQVVFSDFDRFLRQNYEVRLFNVQTGQGRILARGLTGRTQRVAGGGMVTAGIFDDPFFFNAPGFTFFRQTSLGERPLPPGMNPLSMLVPPALPINSFGNFNTLAIVLEVPSRLLTTRGNPNIKVWIRSLDPMGNQIDRTALPAINTAAVPTALQGQFNLITPREDFGLRGGAAAFLTQLYGTSPSTAMVLAETVLPDMMPFNVNSSAGFNDGLTLTLNGRRLRDDVIDPLFNAVTEGALTSDFVVNDSVFRRNFPYLGPPLPVNFLLNQ